MLDAKMSPKFKQAAKKLGKKNLPLARKIAEAMDTVRKDPYISHLKSGDLAGIRCYDFFDQGINYELAYSIEEEFGEPVLVYLLLVGTRENFYQDLKNYLK